MNIRNLEQTYKDENSDKAIPFRLRVGIIGHRELPDDPALVEQIAAVLNNNLFDAFNEPALRTTSNRSHTPVLLAAVTPLAEGADCLLARQILQIPGAILDVALPMPASDYLTTFTSDKSRNEFNELLSLADKAVVLSSSQPEVKGFAYDVAGRYVVDHCDVLVAIWDGQPARGRGGTAETVQYAHKTGRPCITISTVRPYGISMERGADIVTDALSQVETYNAFGIKPDEEQRYMTNMQEMLFNNDEGRMLPVSAVEEVTKYLLPVYVRGSLVAKRYQRLYQRAGLFTYLIAAAAIAAVAVGILEESLALYAFIAEFALLSTALFLVTYANNRRAHRRWIESRFLTERIRSAIFLAVCGIDATPVELPVHMMTAHRPDDWMVRVFDEVWRRLPVKKGIDESDWAVRAGFARQQWVKDQLKFHQGKAEKAKRMSQLMERGGVVIFALAMVVAAAHILTLMFLEHGVAPPGTDEILIFLSIVLPALGAAFGGIRSHREYSRLEKRSHSMAAALSDIDSRFELAATPEAVASLLRTMDELMLRETQDWLMLMRFIDLKPEA